MRDFSGYSLPEAAGILATEKFTRLLKENPERYAQLLVQMSHSCGNAAKDPTILYALVILLEEAKTWVDDK